MISHRVSGTATMNCRTLIHPWRPQGERRVKHPTGPREHVRRERERSTRHQSGGEETGDGVPY
jgi:hypothetical protein